MKNSNFRKLIRKLRKGEYNEKPQIQGAVDSVEGREGRGEPQPQSQRESSDRGK